MTMRTFLAPFGLKPKKVETGPRYADVNDRSMAAAIDVMLLYLLLGKLSQYINDKVFAAYGMQPLGYNVQANDFEALKHVMWEVRWPWLTTNFIIVLLMGVIMVACQMAYRTTPGKWLLGLSIVRDETLEPVARWRYIVRFLGCLVSGFPIMLGFIWMNFNKKHRGWHDYIAGTVVLSLRPKGWYMAQLKRGYRKLRGKPEPLPMEQPVSEPPATERHGDGDKPVE